MRIVCPQCEFAREVPDDKIPARSNNATCPKCGLKFQFRDLPDEADAEHPAENTSAPEDSSAASAPDNSAQAQDQAKGQAQAQTGEDSRFWDSIGDIPQPGARDQSRPEGPDGFDERDFDEAPWERRAKIGFGKGFIDTAKLVCFNPKKFFSGLRIDGLRDPFIYGLFISEIVVLTSFIWEWIFSAMGVPTFTLHQPSAPHTLIYFIMTLVGGTVMVVPMYLVAIFLQAALLHIFLKLLRGAGRGFAGSFAAVTYSSAPMLLTVIPYVGQIVGPIWSMAILAIAFKYIHRTSYTRIMIAWTLPFLLLLLLVLVAFYNIIDKMPLALF